MLSDSSMLMDLDLSRLNLLKIVCLIMLLHHATFPRKESDELLKSTLYKLILNLVAIVKIS